MQPVKVHYRHRFLDTVKGINMSGVFSVIQARHKSLKIRQIVLSGPGDELTPMARVNVTRERMRMLTLLNDQPFRPAHIVRGGILWMERLWDTSKLLVVSLP